MTLTAGLGKVRIAKLEVCLGRDEQHWRCVWEINDMLDVHGRDKQCWMYMGKMCMARWRSTLNGVGGGGGGCKTLFCGCRCRRLGQNSNTGCRHLGEPVHAYLHGYKCILGVMRKMLNEVL